jgi:hypothetical protein
VRGTRRAARPFLRSLIALMDVVYNARNFSAIDRKVKSRTTDRPSGLVLSDEASARASCTLMLVARVAAELSVVRLRVAIWAPTLLAHSRLDVRYGDSCSSPAGEWLDYALRRRQSE